MLFALTALARGNAQHHSVNVLASLFDGHPAVGNPSAVDVHVFFLGLLQTGVGGQVGGVPGTHADAWPWSVRFERPA